VSCGGYGTVLGETNAALGPASASRDGSSDSATGLYYYRARFYDPFLGRFLSGIRSTSQGMPTSTAM
jgi:RHS repeat-associated protein